MRTKVASGELGKKKRYDRAETLWRGGKEARNKRKTPGGVGCVANKGLAGGGFWMCGK